MFGFRKNKKQKIKYTKTYTVKDSDNIISIAQVFDVPWKELARENNIEPPYILISGEKLRVPDLGEVDDGGSERIDEIKPDSGDNVENKKTNVKSIKKNIISPEKNLKAQRQKPLDNKKPLPQSDSIAQKPISPVKKTTRIHRASPTSMLEKPSSEPTTRAIDIEWLKGDEEVYKEEVQIQKKKLNKWFMAVGFVALMLIGGGIWWGYSMLFSEEKEKSVSVENLIKEEQQTDSQDKQKDLQQDGDNQQDNKQENKKSNKDEDAKSSESSDIIKDIKVRVLNAGAPASTVEQVKEEFDKLGYDVLSIKNSKYNHSGVTIYYDEKVKDKIDEIAKIIPEKYGTVKKDEAKSVTDEYKADIVVVVGN